MNFIKSIKTSLSLKSNRSTACQDAQVAQINPDYLLTKTNSLGIDSEITSFTYDPVQSILVNNRYMCLFLTMPGYRPQDCQTETF